MEAVRELQKRYCSRAMAGAIVIALLLILLGFKAAGRGLVLGTVFSIFNFILMAEFSPFCMAKTRKKTFFLSLGSLFFRHLILALPIIAAVRFENFNLMAAIIGIFMIQFIILSDHLMRLIPGSRGKQV